MQRYSDCWPACDTFGGVKVSTAIAKEDGLLECAIKVRGVWHPFRERLADENQAADRHHAVVAVLSLWQSLGLLPRD
jgi:hypothetical protein